MPSADKGTAALRNLCIAVTGPSAEGRGPLCA